MNKSKYNVDYVEFQFKKITYDSFSQKTILQLKNFKCFQFLILPKYKNKYFKNPELYDNQIFNYIIISDLILQRNLVSYEPTYLDKYMVSRTAFLFPFLNVNLKTDYRHILSNLKNDIQNSQYNIVTLIASKLYCLKYNCNSKPIQYIIIKDLEQICMQIQHSIKE